MFKRGVMAVAVLASWVMAAPARSVEVGDVAPEIQADRWYNAPGPVSLAQLRGHVVVVEFWATYCGPCHAIQPRLAAIHDRLGPKGMVLVSMSDEPEAIVTPFLSKNPASYIQSAGGDTPRRYGIKGIPAAFVIDRRGIIAWRGNPHEGGFEEAIERAMGIAGSQPSQASVSSGSASNIDQLIEMPSGRRSGNSTPASASASQRQFEDGATSTAVVKKSSRPAEKSVRSKQTTDNKVASSKSKTNRKTTASAKSNKGAGKVKSATLVKKGSPARKPAKKTSAKRK